MASEKEDQQQIFARTRALVVNHSPILHKALSPFCSQTPYTKTVYESALRTLTGSDIRRFRTYSSLEGLILSAFVHSKVGGRKWYISIGILSSSSISPIPVRYSCTCITKSICEHVVSLILFASLLQELPEFRPNWAACTHTLPSATVSSAHFMKLYGNLVIPLLEQKTRPFLFQMICDETQDHSPTIWFDRPPKKGEPKRSWTTSSWKKGLKKLKEIVGVDSDSENEEEEVSVVEIESENEEDEQLESNGEVEDVVIVEKEDNKVDKKETESRMLKVISSGTGYLS